MFLDLPTPTLAYIDKLKVSVNIPSHRDQTSTTQTTTATSRHRQDSFNAPDSDPWASPAAAAKTAPQTSAYESSTVTRNAHNHSASTTTRPAALSSTRTTSEFTTNDTMPDHSTPAGRGEGVAATSTSGGWGSDDAVGGAGFAGTSGTGGFGDANEALVPPAARPVGARGAAGAGEEWVTVTIIPEKEGVFMFQHRNYEVKSARRGSSVVRRYSDFVWLLDCLHKRYPFRQLPLLPPKTLAVNGRHLSSDIAFIEKRRRGLVRFINGLARHPVLREETLVVMFLTVPTELSVWRKQATISVQEEFTGKPLPAGLEDSLPTNLAETFDTVRAGVIKSAESYIELCSLMERLGKRRRGFAADSLRFSQALRGLAEETQTTYAVDTNDVPLLNEGLRATAKHLETSHGLLEDESRAWDDGVLEDLKRQRDCLVSVRDMFERRDRLAKNNIPQLEKRIEANEVKLQTIRQRPEGTGKPGEADKVAQAIINVCISSFFVTRRLTYCTGQAVYRAAARARRVYPRMHPRRAAHVPAQPVPRQQAAPGLEPGARQVCGARGGQLARAVRRGGQHAAGGLMCGGREEHSRRLTELKVG